MKRKLKWLAIVLAVSLLGFGTALLLWPRDRITVESWQKIRIGMTEDEVAEILGGPRMSWSEFEARYVALQKQIKMPGVAWRPDTDKVWMGQRGILILRFDEGRVIEKLLYDIINPSLIDRIRDWLGW